MELTFKFPEDLGSLAIAILVPLVGGFVGALTTASEIKGWYQTIRKPSWNPPNWLFGPVWTVLYIAMGVASWLVFKSGDIQSDPNLKQALILYIIQLSLNFLWTPLFFKLHWLGAASVEIIAMLVAIILTVAAFVRQIGPLWPLLLMGPYILWVSFASCLTIWIWWNNRPAAAAAAAQRKRVSGGGPEGQLTEPLEQI